VELSTQLTIELFEGGARAPFSSIVRHDLVQLFLDSEGSSGGSDFVGMILAAMPNFGSTSRTSLMLATKRLCASI
jgi:hypothetical protein